MDTTNELSIIQPAGGLMDYEKARSTTLEFFKSQMKDKKDYGIIPGTGKKSLWQPGAEKLANLFGFTPDIVLIKEVEDFEHGFVYYKYRCTLTHFSSGKFVGSVERSCNNRERKYKNQVVYDVANTVQAMAQKRALVAAVRTATMATEIFSEDDGVTENTQVKYSNDADEEYNRKCLIATKKLFSAAGERGIKPESLKLMLYKRFNVDSVTKLELDELEKAYEGIVENYKIVSPGEAPNRIIKPSTRDEDETEEVTEEEIKDALTRP